MATDISVQTFFVTITGATFTLPKGFTSAVVTNDGVAAATFTNTLGQTYSLGIKEVFEWKNYGNYYTEIEIDATATTVRIAYTTK
jgi:hypothetical protein